MSRAAAAVLLTMLLSLAPCFLPAVSTPAATTQSLYCGLWRVDGGFSSTIRIHNALVTEPLRVTPVLFMADGTEYDLPAVTLAPTGVTTIDVNEALSTAPPSIAAHLSEFGSAALRYQYPRPAALQGSILILDAGESLSFAYPFNPLVGASAKQQTLEGLWWKQDSGVGGFVAVSNVTSQPMQATVEAIGSAGTVLPARTLSLPPNSTQMLDLSMLLAELPPQESGAGGLRVRYSSAYGSLVVSGGLTNPAKGYSALIPFSSHGSKPLSPETVIFASAGVMLGAQPAGMGFPTGIHFSPYAVARNTSSHPLDITPTVYFASGGQPSHVTLASQHLAPNQARELDMDALFAAAGLAHFSGNATLTFSFIGSPGDLVLATGSIDASDNFVFAVPPDFFGPSLSKEICFWSVAEGNDTMISLWNPGDTPEDVVVTLYFAGGSGHYKAPLHIAAKAEGDLDLMELIMTQEPDAEGNVIPMDAMQGSATVSGPHGETDPIYVSVSAAQFNPAIATCQTNCTNCAGFTGIDVTDDPFAVAVNGTHQLTATAYYSTGSQVNETSSAAWSSSNTSLATVSSGLVSGVSPGAPDIFASMNLLAAGQNCPGFYDENGNPIRCPQSQEFQGGAGGDVKPTITGPTTVWWFNGQTVAGFPTQITLSTQGSGTWNVIANTGAVHLSSTTGSSVNVTGTGTFSQKQNDVQITVTVGGVTSDAFGLTSNGPKFISAQSKLDFPCSDASLQGWDTQINYKLRDAFNNTMAGVGVNEGFSGSNVWPRPTSSGGTTDATGAFTDDITVCASANALTPMPISPQQPETNTLIDSFAQTWCAAVNVSNPWGSPCQGAQVQSGTMKRFIDHGDVTVP